VFCVARVQGCGVPGNIQMVPNEFEVIGWPGARLLQTVHAFSNFNVDPTFKGQSVEVVLLDYFLEEARQQHFHVFKPWQRGAEIIVLYVHHHHGGLIGGVGAVD
jgi:hypothetical protein